MKTLLLTSRKNFVWTSMQEIIPHLERVWSSVEAVEVVNLDDLELSAFVKMAVKVGRIVVACFNYKIVKFVNFLKKELGLDFQIIFYVHNMASIGLWPLKEFGLLDCLKSSDILIVSCQSDFQIISDLIPQVEVQVIPFSLEENEISKLQNDIFLPFKKELYFVGRISRQKNLHQLVDIAQTVHDFKIEIFGTEDNLGNPNMGKDNDVSYFEELKNQISEFQLNNKFKFHGFIEREKIYSEFRPYRSVFISVSVHSDENFGMAAFRALLRGDMAILSNWGGHQKLAEMFPDQVKLVDVTHCDENGMSLDLFSLILAIQSIKDRDDKKQNFFSEELIKKQIEQLTIKGNGVPLNLDNVLEVWERRKKYPLHSMQIFSGYQDRLAQKFFKSYGLK